MNETNFPLEFADLIQVIDQSYEGFILSDFNGRVFYANHAVEHISGLPKEEIVGKTPKEMQQEGIIINQSMKVLKKDPLTISQKLKSGREIFITSKPIYRKNGNLICFIANYRDLSTLNELYVEHQTQLNINYSELQQLRSQILKTDNWVGTSYEMKLLKERVLKVAKTEAIVLIEGESGVGKEVVAKNLHKLSYRKDKPFTQINCGAIPENLFEAELFGYEKGAFTGAQTTKIGLLEVANGGTVLLDEIGEMPLHLQVKLLRVIQTKEITRVGGTRPIKLDVRFLAATNRNLQKQIKEGTFREDLYYRLNVILISIPPLRKRKEDILPLSQYFLSKYNAKYSSKKEFSQETKSLLEQYSWPGNVRQLENTIERLVILEETSVITPKHLPYEFKTDEAKILKDEIIPLKKLRDKTEKRMIQLALTRYKSIRQAAIHLGVDHSTLVRKIKRLGL